MSHCVVACNVFCEVTSFSHSRHLYQSCRNSLDVLLRRHSNENMMIITIGKLIQLILIETFNVFCFLFLFSLWLHFALQTNLSLFYSSVPLSSSGGSGEQQEASNNTAIFFWAIYKLSISADQHQIFLLLPLIHLRNLDNIEINQAALEKDLLQQVEADNVWL